MPNGAPVRALLPELGTLTRQHIAKLVGVTPMNCDSGQMQGKRRIRGGRAPVRVALSMATLSAVRWAPLLKAHYQQLRARGRSGRTEGRSGFGLNELLDANVRDVQAFD